MQVFGKVIQFLKTHFDPATWMTPGQTRHDLLKIIPKVLNSLTNEST
jgi:hypothetical protein